MMNDDNYADNCSRNNDLKNQNNDYLYKTTTGLRTRTVHCIHDHSVVDEKLCDAAVSFADCRNQNIKIKIKVTNYKITIKRVIKI